MGNYSGLVQNYSFSYHSLIIWIILYIAFLLLSSLVIFLPLNFVALKEKVKDKNLKIFIILSFILISIVIISLSKYAANSGVKEDTWIPELTGRPIGRYIEIITPLIVINGLITYYKYKKEVKKQLNKFLFITIPLILLSSQLMFFSLFPLNNMSLSEIGSLKFILEKIFSENISIIIITIIMLLILFSLIYLNVKKRLINKNFLRIIVVFFIIISLMNFALTYYNSKTFWYNNPQEKLSLWIKENIPENSLILIDKDDCGEFNKDATKILCTDKKSTQLTALWIMNKVIVEPIDESNADYIITTKKLNLELIKNTENEIYLYKTNR